MKIQHYLLLSLTGGFALHPIASAQVGTISGHVVDRLTNEPLIGANVVVIGTTNGAATDLNGEFVIKKVPIGAHSVRASILGHLPMVKTDVVVSSVNQVELLFALDQTEFEVGETEITAEYFPKLTETLLSTQIQTNEEIRRLPGGFEDVVRAISILPGVAQVQPGRNDLIVRGGAPSENLYVVDNIEVPNINHFGTQGSSGGPLSYINLDFVESTSFSTGGFGARYGDRLSSVLRIGLRDGRKGNLGGKATIGATQFGLNLEGGSEEAGYIFSARRSYLDFIFKAAGFGFVPEYWDFMGKGTMNFGGLDKLTILGIGALDNVKLLNDSPDKRFSNSRILSSDQNQFVGGLSWRHVFSSGYSDVTLSRTYTDYRYVQRDSMLVDIFRNKSYEDEYGLRADLVVMGSKSTELSVGVQSKFVWMNTEAYLRPFWTNYGQQISVDAVFDTMAEKSAAYAQIMQGWGPVRISLGGRLDYFNLLETRYDFSPRLSLSYELLPTTKVSASVGRYAQAPSYVWLVANPENRKLKFIQVLQYVLGFEHLVSIDTKFSIEVYRKQYSNYPASVTRPYLVLANTGAGYGGSDDGFSSFGLEKLVSAGSGETHGVELFMQKRLSEIPCYGTVSISYNDSRFKALDGVARPSAWDQRWIVNVGGGYIFEEHWEFSAKFRYATGRPYTPYNPDGTQNAALFNTERIRANHSLDIRVDRRWTFDGWALITYLDIQNIYNRKPVDVPRFNERTQEVEGSNAIGILPSIGVSAEF
ncbi:MAG: TonB-dependent receptor [Bacteroidota bacterium]